MTCEHIVVDGVHAIVCTSGRRRKLCGCGAAGTLLCDWRVGRTKSGKPKTCDRPICAAHAQEVAPDKHLCPEHQVAYAAWLERQRAKVGT